MGRPANDLGPPTDRFSHDLAAPDSALAPAEPPAPPAIELAPPRAEAAVPVDSAEPLPSPPRAPEWPPAWLRVVQPEPEPEPEPILAPAPVEPAAEESLSPGDYAHAFGLTMAAALDHATEADATAPETGERPPVQRPLIARSPRARPRPARPDEAVPSDDASTETAPEARSVAAEPPGVTRLDVMDAPLFGSIGGTAARPPRPTRPSRATLRRPDEDRPDAAARTERASERTLPGAVYLLYLTGFLAVPALLGVILAFNARRRAPAWLKGHYLYQIRTFWIGGAGVAVAAALAVSSLQATEFAGLALMMLLVLWLLLRAAAGYARLLKLQVHPHPRTWLV
jgi:uncharacterized membrane protein